MSEELEYIIELLGNKNEELDDDLIDGLSEEISTLDNDILYDLTLEVIGLGKWQLLATILDNHEFTREQIDDFKDALEDYVNDSGDDGNNEDEDETNSIGLKMETIIIETEDPVHWMKSKKMK